jgi:hypothetical protein
VKVWPTPCRPRNCDNGTQLRSLYGQTRLREHPEHHRFARFAPKNGRTIYSPFWNRRIVAGGTRQHGHSPDSWFLPETYPKSGPFPPPALPGFYGTTSLSATPHGPACPSRASGWQALPATVGVSRVASDLLVQTCRRPYPGGNAGSVVARM